MLKIALVDDDLELLQLLKSYIRKYSAAEIISFRMKVGLSLPESKYT